MFTKELLNKIKQVTNEILFHSEPVHFETAKLKDSEQEVKYSELAKGSDVSISSSTGDQPAPDGQYDLDSGVSFKVEGGKISEVIEAPQNEELAVADDPQAEGAEDNEAKTDQNVLDKIAELEQAIADIKSALDESKQAEDSEAKTESEEFSKLKNDVKSIAEVLNALANTPAEFSKSDSRIESQDSKQEKLAHLASIISKK